MVEMLRNKRVKYTFQDELGELIGSKTVKDELKVKAVKDDFNEGCSGSM